jgi:cephalosporin-C deacetylase-like acetyl esterase
MVPHFEQYWERVRQDHWAGRARGLGDWEILPRGERVEARGMAWSVDWLRFSSAADTLIYGWLAKPLDHEPTGVGLLWLPGYSYGTPPSDESNLVRGAVTIGINVHGNHPDAPYVNPAGKNDYMARGIEDAEAFILRRIALHCLHAMDVIGKIEGVDKQKTVVGGMSQGGGLALITAANHPAPKLCFADMPFLCDIRRAMTLSHSGAYRAVRSVMEANPSRAEAILSTLCLFDTLAHAPRVAIPTSLTSGGRDPASRAATIEPVYDALASTIKSYRHFPDAGHVFLPEMVQLYTDWIDWLLLDRGHFTDD